MPLIRNKEVELYVIFITLSNFFWKKRTREKAHKETIQKNNPDLLSRIKNIKKGIKYLIIYNVSRQKTRKDRRNI